MFLLSEHSYPSVLTKLVRFLSQRCFLLLTLSMVSLATNAASSYDKEALAQEYALKIFNEAKAEGMAMVVIHNDTRLFLSHGETIKGNGKLPRPTSLIRIASLTKPMVSEVLMNLVDENIVNIDDPLSQYAPKGKKVPLLDPNHPITLLSLAIHASGLPREQPNKPGKRAVFTWPTYQDRWQYLPSAVPDAPAMTTISYSNLGYDLLADAMSNATGQPFEQLLQKYVFSPNNMRNTTLTPSQAQCDTLMRGFNYGPCQDNRAAHGSGGIYSTPEDIGNWMQGFLNRSNQPSKRLTKELLWAGFKREQFAEIIGMDVPGKATYFGLGWAVLDPNDELNTPRIIQKTGGGGGFVTYMALIPEKNIGVFTVVTRTNESRFKGMSDNVNQLVAKLAELSL
ncbi:D-alanyl-D-alanine-carboxypeptidase/endopeptidase AmpH [Thorsellia kenyensis]|uniref:D-alanyl-D-alanine-carboxypeptidase/endopeptidase AmpH n=1 Tax=Thorsellia kenyensis TaxID=1549888 RepID=A0ABV6CEJ6_9GAMM